MMDASPTGSFQHVQMSHPEFGTGVAVARVYGYATRLDSAAPPMDVPDILCEVSI
jgi:hypothetical protein